MQSVFICQQCGNEFSKWQGKCSACGEWNSLVETARITRNQKLKSKEQKLNAKIQKLSEIQTTKTERITTGISELDRALGGGIVTGQVILLAGEPGIGKSTLLLQVANSLQSTVYVSGEESINQVAIRAKRLGINNKGIQFLESTDVDEVVEKLSTVSEAWPTSLVDGKLSAVIVDSIQTMSTDDLTGLAGSIGQVRECAFRLLKFAKSNSIPVIMVGHATKEGTVAGPSVLMHIVDTVLWFEGEKMNNLRLLRSVKNRFGGTDEVGIFSMEDKGLVSLDNPEKLFLEGDLSKKTIPGSALSIVMEGTRSILVEVESLVVPTKMAFPKRVAQGIDSKRLEMLLATLIRRIGIKLYEMDVFVNITGGIKTKDPAIDLAVCLSIISSFYDKPLPSKFLSFGEVGLLGEIRNVQLQEKRIKDARRLGYKDTISPSNYKSLPQVVHNLFSK